ncbi:MAG: carbohydrate ABC transporter permease [Anaerolineae bacterium]|nr:carbohydrate ABC transporter permease [Anaerolineales bacterium]MCQ3973214.1 carbohydrate ABC transporter permease [Anaerolineae bacterium]
MTTQTATMPGSAARPKLKWGRIAAWSVMILLIFITLFPFWWVVRTSLSTQKLLLSNTTSLLPVGFTTDNFARVLGLLSTEEAVAAGGSGQAINFLQFLRNSFIVTTLLVLGQIFFSSLAAYAFARLQFPLRDKIFFIYLTALMVPGIVTLIPNFILIRNLGWLDTFQGIIAPKFLMTPFAVFFLRQFFLTVNREVEEAAKIDGASLFGVFWRVVLPISIAPLTTLAILTFLTEWNDYLWPFLVGKDESVRVLTVALGIFRSQTPQGAPDWGGLMAGAIVTMIPTLILFGLAGRKAIDSIQFSGIK